MAWWNPWGEAAQLRKELAFQTQRAERNANRALDNDIIIARKTRENVELTARLEQAVYDVTALRKQLQQVGVVRDPKTGRLTKAVAA